ncbi:MAG TPA: TolC family protein, partial [Guyparkeria sp.]|nr:TolC family protein [Guyparkeria sp.]
MNLSSKHMPWLALLSALVTGTLPTGAIAGEDLLTLEVAERTARQHDEGLQAAEHRREGLAAEAQAAAELPDPQLSVSLENVPTNNYSLSDSPMTQTVVTLSQTLPPGDTLAYQAKAASA